MKKTGILVLTMLSLLICSCGACLAESPQKAVHYIETQSLNQINGKIQILRQCDLDKLEVGVSYDMVLNLFGEPFPAESALLAWPRERKDLHFTGDNVDALWVNGYWFLFNDFRHDFGGSALLMVASHGQQVEPLKEESLISSFGNMTINWPPSLAGTNVSVYLETIYPRVEKK